jgi:hypothetical protein
MRREGCADGRSWLAEGQFGNAEEKCGLIGEKKEVTAGANART